MYVLHTHVDIPHVRISLELSQMIRQRKFGTMLAPLFDLFLSFFGSQVVVIVDAEACDEDQLFVI